jgi:hypothetical protein
VHAAQNLADIGTKLCTHLPHWCCHAVLQVTDDYFAQFGTSHR